MSARRRLVSLPLRPLARRLARAASGAACAVAATGLVATAPAAAAPSAVNVHLFAPTSVWNAALPPGAPLSSDTRPAAGLTTAVAAEEAGHYGPWMNTDQYSTPLYVAGAGQPRVPVTVQTPWAGELQPALGSGVPVPPDAVPAAGSDAEMTIYQPSTDTLWEFWQMRRLGRGWAASWGGVMPDVSHNQGYYLQQGAPGTPNWEQAGWGATATSLPAIAGTILPSEVLAGSIDHALAMAVPNTCAGTWLWPAQRSDGGSTASDCIPEGAHFRLNPNLDLASLDLPPFTLLLAQAAQRYGVIVRDTAPEVEFFGLDTSHTGGDGGAFAAPPWDVLPQFPWSDLELLQAPRCSQTPCAGPPALAVAASPPRTRPVPRARRPVRRAHRPVRRAHRPVRRTPRARRRTHRHRAHRTVRRRRTTHRRAHRPRTRGPRS